MLEPLGDGQSGRIRKERGGGEGAETWKNGERERGGRGEGAYLENNRRHHYNVENTTQLERTGNACFQTPSVRHLHIQNKIITGLG